MRWDTPCNVSPNARPVWASAVAALSSRASRAAIIASIASRVSRMRSTISVASSRRRPMVMMAVYFCRRSASAICVRGSGCTSTVPLTVVSSWVRRTVYTPGRTSGPSPSPPPNPVDGERNSSRRRSQVTRFTPALREPASVRTTSPAASTISMSKLSPSSASLAQ